MVCIIFKDIPYFRHAYTSKIDFELHASIAPRCIGRIVNATQVPNHALLSFRSLHLPEYLRTARRVFDSDGFIKDHLK